MRTSPSLPRSAATLTMVALVSAATAVFAQQQPQTNEELVTLPAGSVFEILADTTIPQPQVSWVLAQDRSFLQAGRERLFRTRFTQPGQYTLSVEVSDAARLSLLRKVIRITVNPSPASQTVTGTGPLTTNPPLNGANIPLQTGMEIVAFTPNREVAQSMVLDLDINTDSNADGNPRNDNDTAGAFFSTDGTPLHVWFAGFSGSRSLEAIVTLRDGSQQTQTLQLGAGAAQPFPTFPGGNDSFPQPTQPGVQGINYSVVEGTTIAFSVDANQITTNNPVLIHWNFGDGQQSLLDRPVHNYPGEGLYTVEVRVRDLTTGQEIATFAGDISLETPDDGTGEDTGDIGSDGQTSSEDPSGQPSDDGGSMLGFIMVLALIVILAIGLGLGAVFLFSKMRKNGSSLQDTFAKAEKKLLTKDEKQAVIDVVQPLAMPVTEEKAPEQPVAQPEPLAPAPAAADASSMPSWLQPTSTPEPTPAPVEQPTPAPATPAADTAPDWLKPQAPVETPAAVEPEPTPAPAQETAATPDWLKPQEAQQPAPVAEPQPTPSMPEPLPEPEPTPQPVADAAAPAWLQKGMGQPVVETPAPAAVEPAPVEEAEDEELEEETPAPVTDQSTAAPLTEAERVKAEKERERKRAKRKRYQDNKRRREQEEKQKGQAPATEPTPAPSATPQTADAPSDDPVIFEVRADSIEQTEQKEPPAQQAS